jgi:hypothetical protein
VSKEVRRDGRLPAALHQQALKTLKDCGVILGLGRIVALYYHLSTLYHIH